jgi:signal transduction histidine kinase
MLPQGLRLSIAIIAAAALLAAGLINFLIRQQDEALQAADWVANSLDVRANLQKLQSVAEDGPARSAESMSIVDGLRLKMQDHPAAAPALERIAVELRGSTDKVPAEIDRLIAEETRLLRERRRTLAEQSSQARLALLVGGLAVTLLLVTAFAIVIRDNRLRLAAEDDLRRNNEDLEARVVARTADQRLAESRLRELSRRLLQVQEEERRTLARELHDEVGQQLGAIKLNLKALARGSDGSNAARIDDGLQIVEATIAQIRDRALDLRPALLDDLGLAAALDWLCRQQAQRSGVAIACAVPPLPTLPPDLATAIYRIVQEAITNALKHSGAERIDVALALGEDSIDVSVVDNGRGFDGINTVPGVGLPGMRERVDTLGGHLQLESRVAAGTRILVRFPLPNHESANPPPAG